MSGVCLDWRSCDAADVAPLVATEARAWLEHLHWNVAEAWSVVEPARCAGQLPGLVVCDVEGRPAGWTAFLPHHGHLQVMAVAAPDADMAGVLVDGILASAQARESVSTIVCARDGTPGLGATLAARGFIVDSYRYMSLTLSRTGAATHGLDRWSGHEEAMAELCARAYRHAPGVRAFAPGDTPAEWRDYILTLVTGNGCGWFAPELSFVVPKGSLAGSQPRGLAGSHARRLSAGIMLTDLGPGTAHVAQMAVDPAAQGRGLGRRLLQAALSEAGAIYERVTLLVSASNTPAVRLYESVGFRDTASFVVAAREGWKAAGGEKAARLQDYEAARVHGDVAGGLQPAGRPRG